MSAKPWGGVFDGATDPRVEKFTESVSFDHRLYAQDVRGSIAHANMLAAVGVLTPVEAKQISVGLEEIGGEIAAGTFAFRQDLEDVHMNIERALIDRIGDVGRKLHTGRSRNDQVSTDFRLWIRDTIDQIDALLTDLQRAFVQRCGRDEGVILPGYTHLQRAQPVLANHYWLAYCEKLQRDRSRLADCRGRVNQLPLGTAALAGTTIAIDRQMVADSLGFEGVVANSLDSSSDRDFAIEFAFVLTMIAEHLSTWAEEWILWSTCEFNFLQLPQAYCTGSSIMPQKINPDVLELTRGKTARVVGNLQALLVLVKGLPLAYNRDLQEDKERVFDSADTVSACLELAAAVVAGAELNREAISSRLEHGYLDATTLMEYLIGHGVPQRSAHEIIGRLVASAMKQRMPLAELPLAEFQQAHSALDEKVFNVLGVEHAIAAFQSVGSTAPPKVAEQVASWRNHLGC
ncbi:argininosuccinate lyase [Bythopirellula polymerisocia]|uniref:Argininosuccinate lyase n=1 Tax=Bythopirellula polymerisocia TaxID=2528003 RepID=A0A5C6CZ74_9BACT|nr:argininosuccinate lyase [Bythopirellula polymerisocia]TWU29900.1 Argininosuccinate lyase [Bythopirellula polymerisocia]